MISPNGDPGFQTGDQAPTPAEAGASVEHLVTEGTIRPVGQTAIDGVLLGTGDGPKYFRDHTNPFTMETPDWWGSNRRT